MHKIRDWEDDFPLDEEWQEDRGLVEDARLQVYVPEKVCDIAETYLNKYKEAHETIAYLHTEYRKLKQECNQAKADLRELRALIRQGITEVMITE